MPRSPEAGSPRLGAMPKRVPAATAAIAALAASAVWLLHGSGAWGADASPTATPAKSAAPTAAKPATAKPAAPASKPGAGTTQTSPSAASVTQAPSSPAPTVASAGQAHPPTAAGPAVAAAKPKPASVAAKSPASPSLALRPGAPSGPAVARTVSATPSVSAMPAAPHATLATKPAAAIPSAVPQDERVTYHYNALGRRDPFQPLVGGGFVGMDVGGDAPPDIGGLKVVGIVWGAQDKFALAEDPRGNSLVLRKGDKVMNGVVDGLKRDAIVVKLSTDGQTESVEIPLTRKGDQSNANH